jgi:hypothetical protein
VTRVWRSKVDARHAHYLNRLIKQPPAHPSKRSNWLKFCHMCGSDISTSPRGVKCCGRCVGVKRLKPGYARSRVA